jgi:hypothetical protein
MESFTVRHRHNGQALEPADHVTPRDVLISKEEMELSCELGSTAAHELIRRVLAIIGDGTNAGLRAWCIDFLAGTNVFGGQSETKIAMRWGFTRANVSHLIRKLKRELGLSTVRGGKADAASSVYAARAKRNHAEGRGKGNRPKLSFKGASYFQSITCKPQN